MRARAVAAAATHRRLIEATIGLFEERFWDEVTLDDVADRAGVSVQTLIRHFGTRDGLFAAAAEEVRELVTSQRDRAPVGDLAADVRNLVDHYEQWGEVAALRLLAQEQRDPTIASLVESGRALHREWVERVFAPLLDRRSGVSRQRLLAQLVAACDVYFWKVLRRDMGLSRRNTERAILDTIVAIEASI
jgi:AcrR family transcriptional regulator